MNVIHADMFGDNIISQLVECDADGSITVIDENVITHNKSNTYLTSEDARRIRAAYNLTNSSINPPVMFRGYRYN